VIVPVKPETQPIAVRFAMVKGMRQPAMASSKLASIVRPKTRENVDRSGRIVMTQVARIAPTNRPPKAVATSPALIWRLRDARAL